MARMVPETMLEFDPQGREDLVFNALKEGLDGEYWVFHSCAVNQTGANGAFYEREVDFVVYHREKGILCLEVKNGSGISYYGGIWRYSSGQPMPHRGPFKQAQLERISICNLLSKRGEEAELLQGKAKFRDIGRRCKVAWGVWFHGMAKADLDAVNFPPETPRDRVLTLEDLDPAKVKDAIDRLFAVDAAHAVVTNLDDEDHWWILDDVLAPRIPGLCPSKRTKTDFNEVIYRQLIQEQSRVLDFLDGQKSAVINGMAGTGKTFVAIERARRCAARGERTLYLCFNTALRDCLRAEFASAHSDLVPKVDFKTLDDFVVPFGGPLPDNLKKMEKAKAVELQLHRYTAAAQALRNDPSKLAYTQVIIDEGQDCSIPFIEQSGIMEVLRNAVTGKSPRVGFTPSFFMFYDAYQLVSAAAKDKAKLPRVIRESDCKLTLYKNCRNTSAIAISAARGVLDAGRSPEMAAGALAGTMPEVRFLDPAVAADDFALALGRRIKDLREQFRPEEIVIISCAPFGSGYSRIEKKLSPKGADGKVFNQVYQFSTYRKFKGLDAPVVILVDVDKSAFIGTHGAMPFYEGASRARQKLIVFASMTAADCSEVLNAFEQDGRAKSTAEGDKCAHERLAELFHLQVDGFSAMK